jgi:maltooligosyltrehalose trehalohydrolase
MRQDENGFYSTTVPAPAGAKYRFEIDNDMTVPDPASRLQSGDVHDDSIIAHTSYIWQNPDWHGRPWEETVLYELHPGTLGGFNGIAAQLPRLAALGITAIELMPIADFPGARNWGYDGVLIYAPDTAYGTPDELRQMIDTAHGLGMQVFLDVVYNHFGPDGNYLHVYASSFFEPDTHTPWGRAIDFGKPEVRQFFIQNALYWLHEIRFDGLRFDAVHAIGDAGFLLDMAAQIRAAVPPGRHVHLVLENEENDASLLNTRTEAEKYTAQWCDDWHHCLHVLLTGESEGYYEDFKNPIEKLAICLTEGFAYQGEPSAHADGQPRGTPSGDLPSTDFVICLQNHDQVGNRAFGERLQQLAHPAALRAATVLLLLMPQIPMIFMGEEWGESRPFLFFTDHHAELGRLVTEGRRQEFAKFEAFQNAQTRELIPDPNAVGTFEASLPEPVENEWTALFRHCLALRHEHIIPRLKHTVSLGAITLSDHAVRAAWCMGDGAVLTIAINLGDAPAVCVPGPGDVLYGDAALTPRTTCVWLAA